MWNLLRSYKNYRYLVGSRFISAFGSHLSIIALPIYLYQLSGDATLVGIFFAWETIPWVVLGPFAGLIADRYDRKKVLLCADILSGFIMIALAYTTSRGMIFALAFLLGTMNATAAATYGAMLPMSLPKGFFQEGYAYYNMGATVLRLTVPALGGFSLKFLRAESLFLIDAVTFFLGAFFLIFVHILNPIDSEGKIETHWRQFRNGFLSLKRNKILSFALLNECVKTLAEALTFPILVVLIVEVYAFPKDFYGYFQAVSALGAFFGAYFAGKLFKRFHNFLSIFLGSLLLFASYMMIAIPFGFPLLLCVTLIGHLGDGFRTVVVHTIFGMETKDRERGAAIGQINAVIATVYTLGYFLSGFFSNWIGPQNLLMAVALGAGILWVVIHNMRNETNKIVKNETNNLKTNENISFT